MKPQKNGEIISTAERERQWLINWLNNTETRKRFQENAKQLGRYEWDYGAHVPEGWPVYIKSDPTTIKRNLSIYPQFRQLDTDNQTINGQIKNLKSAKYAIKRTGDTSIDGSTIDERYDKIAGATFRPVKGFGNVQIELYPDGYYNESTPLHEFTHALHDAPMYGKPTGFTLQNEKDLGLNISGYEQNLRKRKVAEPVTPQQAKILQILYDKNETSYRQDQYIYDPDEIYARIMQSRYNLGLKPGQKVTQEFLMDPKNYDKLNDILKDNLSFDTLVRLFNEVASNDTQPLDDFNDKPLYAKQGTKLKLIPKRMNRLKPKI